jgi:hypothetical protein
LKRRRRHPASISLQKILFRMRPELDASSANAQLLVSCSSSFGTIGKRSS